MTTQNDLDTSIAKIVTQVMATDLSLYSSMGHEILNKVSIEPLTYGKRHITRPISSPFNDVTVDREFAASDQLMDKEVQEIDLVCISKRIMIRAIDYAGDQSMVRKQVSDALDIMKDGIEKYWIEGSSTRIVNYGVKDPPGTGSTTVSRPDTLPYTHAADWKVITVMQAEVSAALSLLIAAGFSGPYAMLAPTICKPLFANVMTDTAVPVSTWLSSALGLPVIFSPQVDDDAVAATAFDVYIIDLSKVHLGLSDLKIDAYYSNKDHAYVWDFEVYMSALFDPTHDGTDYDKGVATILAIDWTD